MPASTSRAVGTLQFLKAGAALAFHAAWTLCVGDRPSTSKMDYDDDAYEASSYRPSRYATLFGRVYHHNAQRFSTELSLIHI
mgnify:FL=1